LVTEDGGDHWAKVPDIPYLIHDIHFLDSLHGFAVGEDKKRRGILLETIDRGESWNEVIFAESLSGPVYALHFAQGLGWAVGYNSLILKYVPSSTSNKEYPVKRDENFFHNYPNPFHSTTLISYELPAAGDVEISIYDLSGRKAATLMNASQAAGKHEIDWNAGDIHPGIYFCELKTIYGRQVIKMILIE
jgi:hypothetical protein